MIGYFTTCYMPHSSTHMYLRAQNTRSAFNLIILPAKFDKITLFWHEMQPCYKCLFTLSAKEWKQYFGFGRFLVCSVLAKLTLGPLTRLLEPKTESLLHFFHSFQQELCFPGLSWKWKNVICRKLNHTKLKWSGKKFWKWCHSPDSQIPSMASSLFT